MRLEYIKNRSKAPEERHNNRRMPIRRKKITMMLVFGVRFCTKNHDKNDFKWINLSVFHPIF